MAKSYFLLKSEPDVWSIDQQKKAGAKGATWDGVRNYQAAKNLRSMKLGDQCFFYHSNIGKEIVGVVEVIKEAYIDKTDKTGKFVAVTVKFLRKLDKPITLENIKKVKKLKHLSLIKQSRLSVMPIDSKSWKILNKMGRIQKIKIFYAKKKRRNLNQKKDLLKKEGQKLKENLNQKKDLLKKEDQKLKENLDQKREKQ